MSSPEGGAALLHRAARVRRAILLALVFAMPTLFLWGITHDPFNAPKLALLVLGGTCVVAIRAAEALWGRRVRRVALLWPAAFVLVPLAVAWVATEYKAWSVLGEYRRFEGLLPTVLIVVIGVLTAEAFRDRLRSLAWSFGASAVVVAAYAMAQSLGIDPFGMITEEYAPSTLGQSNFAGAFLAISLPVLLGLWWVESGGRRYAAAAASVLVALGIMFTFSQGGWAAGIAGAAVFAALVQPARNRWSRLGTATAALVAIGVVALVAAGIVLPSDSFVPATVRARGMWWQSAVQMGLDSPLWGHGPNVYAIEAGHYRTLEDALAHVMAFSDAPHSVPLSLFANAGALGLAGFVLLVAWTVRRLSAMGPATPLEASFGAATIAYFVQSLVSLDSLVLGFALWIGLGAIAARSADTSIQQGASGRLAAGLAVVAVATSLAAWWSAAFVLADVEVRRGTEAFDEDRPDEGEARFRDALQLRADPQYRTLFVEGLGRTALVAPDEGGAYIDMMRAESEYLVDYPSVAALSVYANNLHQWAAFAPKIRAEALAAVRAAHRPDPYNPVLVTSLSEALIHAGRPEEAVDVAGRFTEQIESEFPAYRDRHPQIPALVSIAARAAGDDLLAGRALDTALEWAPDARTSDCHVIIAAALAGGRRVDDLEGLRERYPNLLLCSPASLALLPGFDPEQTGSSTTLP